MDDQEKDFLEDTEIEDDIKPPKKKLCVFSSSFFSGICWSPTFWPGHLGHKSVVFRLVSSSN